MNTNMEQYAIELEEELHHILNYWIKYTPDLEQGGFIGRIDHDDIPHWGAPKGSVLNARILWSFSAAYRLDAEPRYLEMADRAYQYMARYFLDSNYGGVYWTVDPEGNPLDTKKQIYAIAFAIYAFSEYFMARGLEVAKDHAIGLYEDLVQYSHDPELGGYYEAFGRDWQPIADLRLSDKDANEKKTMNTHLHVLEAFTNLYRIWPDEGLRQRIAALLEDFIKHILDAESAHLKLFFDEEWKSKSDVVSYGHDIEAAWLLLEAAEVLDDRPWIDRLRVLGLKMASATAKGVDVDGGLWYEMDPVQHHTNSEKHWWVQAEAMVGFYNAWQISGDAVFLNYSKGVWAFTKTHIIDQEKGEWFWGIQKNGNLMPGEDKVGLWKCPYHNSRACIELIKRMRV